MELACVLRVDADSFSNRMSSNILMKLRVNKDSVSGDKLDLHSSSIRSTGQHLAIASSDNTCDN